MFLALIILFLASITANAQELTGEEILERIEGKVSLTGSGKSYQEQYEAKRLGDEVLGNYPFTH